MWSAGTVSVDVGGGGGVPCAERSAAEGVTAVWAEPPRQIGTAGDDAGGVDVSVDLVVVALDVIEVDRVTEAGRLEQISCVGPQDRHLGEFRTVALEVAVIDGVEAHQCREQANIGLGDGVADEVSLSLEAVRQAVERCEQPVIGALVASCEPANPQRYTPLLTSSYTQFMTSSISARSDSG